MQKAVYSVVCSLMVSGAVYSQNQQLTITEAVNGLRSNLAIKNISQFSWSKDGKSYVNAVKNGYLSTNIATKKQDTLISLHQLNKVLSHAPLKGMPFMKFDGNKAQFQIANTIYWMERKGQQWSVLSTLEIEKDAQNVTILSDNQTVVYTIDNNLKFAKNNAKKSITNDVNKGIVNGQSVHRQEFGISGGIFAAPNAQSVAFYRMDETMVKDYPVVDWSVTPAENKNIKYPMAGQTSHQVSLGVFSFAKDETVFLDIDGDKEQYLTAVTWSPDSRYVFVGILNRAQNHLKLNQYNASTGQLVKTLFEEKDDKYVEPQHPLLFLPNSNTEFIWQSQRSGFNHLYHYDINKGYIGQITSGDWLVNGILGFNAAKNEIFFTSTKETPLEKHLYKVNWTSKKVTKLSNEAGVHAGILSADGNYLYDSYSNASTPRKIELIQTQTLKRQTILSAENPLDNYATATVNNVTLTANDGTPLFGKLMLPKNFDANKKYPTIVYLYNGPHLQLVTNSFPASGNLWYDYMTQNDYIVFTMDGRGSSNRGLKFEQAVHRQLGSVEMEDQMKGVEYLQSLPYVDKENMGIHGWSFGGFMTTSFMLRKPDVFKVGVAGGPVIDWKMYEIMYTERYMSSPQNNPDGYANSNLLDKVKNLKGKLLMIHGAQDDVVVWQHSINFLKSAVDQGVQVDYFVYPGHAHNVIGKDRVHLMQKVTDYFNLHLKNK